MDVAIRKAAPRDIPRIVELWKDLTHHVHELWSNKAILKLKKDIGPSYLKFVKKHIRSKDGAVFVADKEGKMIGYVLVYIQKLPPILIFDKEAFISDVYVKDKYRRKGIGSMLILEAQKWASRKKVYSLGLTVNVKNEAALAVYRKLGFFALSLKMSKIVK